MKSEDELLEQRIEMDDSQLLKHIERTVKYEYR
jgi:hypothetical protein